MCRQRIKMPLKIRISKFFLFIHIFMHTPGSIERSWTHLLPRIHQIYMYTQSNSSQGRTEAWENTFYTTRYKNSWRDGDMVMEGTPSSTRLCTRGDFTELPECRFACPGAQEKSCSPKDSHSLSEKNWFSELKCLPSSGGTATFLSRSRRAGESHCLCSSHHR